MIMGRTRSREYAISKYSSCRRYRLLQWKVVGRNPFGMHINSKLPPQGKPPRGGGETILLIEDEPDVRTVLRLLLETRGYRVMTAESGMQGLGLFRDNQDIIRVTITDMRMKGMQGIEVIKELRSINVHARIVAVSGFRNGRDLISEEPGRLIFLPKPMSGAELVVAVQSVLL